MSETFTLRPGEVPMENAPEVTLSGARCIPQHYLQYQHTLDSVEQIVADITFDERYPIFVGADHGQLYLQVGIIGYDNYSPVEEQDSRKIVYGRRWRIEPQLPTSEIIQTAFLALQKAREHEVRELLKLKCAAHTTTPFNCHHDLPLLAQQARLLRMQPFVAEGDTTLETLQNWADAIRFDGATLTVTDAITRPNGRYVVDIALGNAKHGHLPELHDLQDSIILETLSANRFYYAVMDVFLSWSNRQVEEGFAYQGFKRFSRENCVQGIAELSYLTREREAKRELDGFSQSFQHNNYETDKTRVPALRSGQLMDRYLSTIAKLNVKNGILPTISES